MNIFQRRFLDTYYIERKTKLHLKEYEWKTIDI